MSEAPKENMTYEEIKQDQEQGTDGPWVVIEDENAEQVRGFPCIYAPGYTVVGLEGMYGDINTDFANARRIARLPELEEAYLTQAAEIEAFKAAQDYTYIGKDGKPRLARDMEDEISRLRRALGQVADIGVAWSDSFENQIAEARRIARAALTEGQGDE
jgi:hypothetical protein